MIENNIYEKVKRRTKRKLGHNPSDIKIIVEQEKEIDYCREKIRNFTNSSEKPITIPIEEYKELIAENHFLLGRESVIAEMEEKNIEIKEFNPEKELITFLNKFNYKYEKEEYYANNKPFCTEITIKLFEKKENVKK